EKVLSFTVAGFDGPQKMAKLMTDLRENPPAEFGGLKVERVRDYKTGVITDLRTGSTLQTGLPASNVLFYDLEDGCSAIIRPSGTEPKVKLYVMVRADDQAASKARLDAVVESGSALLAI
ncbi:MAG: phospho-sugar mutase, partial [Eubacterium sp.]|nr:phospho-sugar mutase [Eubacterium sp.]